MALSSPSTGFLASLDRPGRALLDANAGLAASAAARAAALEAMVAGGNPSSVHAEGRAARARVEAARASVAALAGVPAAHVVFTGSASEAANWALAPLYVHGRRRLAIGGLAIGATEHPAVLAGGALANCYAPTRLPVHRDGLLDLAALSAALARHDPAAGPLLVAVQAANGETGVVQPVAEIGQLCREAGAFLLCDAAQAAGRLPLAPITEAADLTILSAHKIGGVPGAGALILRDPDLCPLPLLTGGGQEGGRRAGTENVPAIAAFGVAASEAVVRSADTAAIARLRDRLVEGFRAIAPETLLAGDGAPRLANTAMVVAPGIAAETAVMAFDLEGVAISAGSACSSGKVGPSAVLAAMGFGDAARSGLRFSLPPEADEADVFQALEAWKIIHPRLISRRAA